MKNRNSVIMGIVAIAILCIALVFTLLDALIPIEFLIHPALNFLLIVFTGFGIMLAITGFVKKSTWFFFLGAALLGFALFYVLINFVVWWLCLIIVPAFWGIFAIISVIRAGNMTESVALNNSDDYKTFDERKAEDAKNAKPDADDTEELPKLKSFKD